MSSAATTSASVRPAPAPAAPNDSRISGPPAATVCFAMCIFSGSIGELKGDAGGRRQQGEPPAVAVA